MSHVTQVNESWYTRAFSLSRTHTLSLTHTFTHAQTQTYTHVRSHTHAHTQTHTNTHKHTLTHTHAHTHTHIHTHTQTHTHTAHMYIYNFACNDTYCRTLVQRKQGRKTERSMHACHVGSNATNQWILATGARMPTTYHLLHTHSAAVVTRTHSALLITFLFS